MAKSTKKPPIRKPGNAKANGGQTKSAKGMVMKGKPMGKGGC
jgi:hypothetical protein